VVNLFIKGKITCVTDCIMCIRLSTIQKKREILSKSFPALSLYFETEDKIGYDVNVMSGIFDNEV
jgi:hypothetical protein